jgi:hypothetical protein
MPDTLEPTAGGPYPSDMESRVAVLEQIARTMASGHERIEHRFDTFEGRFNGLEGRFNGLEGRFNGLENRFSTLDRRFDALSAEQRSDFRWVIAAMLGGFGAMLGVMAHGFHWL